MMQIETEEGVVWTAPYPPDPAKVVVRSRLKRTLESMLNGIELMGMADDYDYDDIAIKRVLDDGSGARFDMVLDRGTLALWFEFEIRYFQHIERNPNV